MVCGGGIIAGSLFFLDRSPLQSLAGLEFALCQHQVVPRFQPSGESTLHTAHRSVAGPKGYFFMSHPAYCFVILSGSVQGSCSSRFASATACEDKKGIIGVTKCSELS